MQPPKIYERLYKYFEQDLNDVDSPEKFFEALQSPERRAKFYEYAKSELVDVDSYEQFEQALGVNYDKSISTPPPLTTTAIEFATGQPQSSSYSEEELTSELQNVSALIQTQEPSIDAKDLYIRTEGRLRKQQGLVNREIQDLQKWATSLKEMVEAEGKTLEDNFQYQMELLPRMKDIQKKAETIEEGLKGLAESEGAILPSRKGLKELTKVAQFNMDFLVESGESGMNTSAGLSLPGQIGGTSQLGRLMARGTRSATDGLSGILGLGAMFLDAAGQVVSPAEDAAKRLRVFNAEYLKPISDYYAAIGSTSKSKGETIENHIDIGNGERLVVDEAKNPLFVRKANDFQRAATKEDIEAARGKEPETDFQLRRAGSQALDAGLDMVRDLAMTGGASKVLGATGKVGQKVTFGAVTGGIVAGNKYQDLYEKGEDLDTAGLNATATGIVIGVTEPIMGGMETRLLNLGVGRGVLDKSLKATVDAFAKGKITKGQVISYLGTQLAGTGVDGVKEAFEEVTQQVLEQGINTVTNTDEGIDEMSWQKAANVAAPSFLVGVFGGGASRTPKVTTYKDRMFLESAEEVANLTDQEYVEVTEEMRKALREEEPDSEKFEEISEGFERMNNLRQKVRAALADAKDVANRELTQEEKDNIITLSAQEAVADTRSSKAGGAKRKELFEQRRDSRTQELDSYILGLAPENQDSEEQSAPGTNATADQGADLGQEDVQDPGEPAPTSDIDLEDEAVQQEISGRTAAAPESDSEQANPEPVIIESDPTQGLTVGDFEVNSEQPLEGVDSEGNVVEVRLNTSGNLEVSRNGRVEELGTPEQVGNLKLSDLDLQPLSRDLTVESLFSELSDGQSSGVLAQGTDKNGNLTTLRVDDGGKVILESANEVRDLGNINDQAVQSQRLRDLIPNALNDNKGNRYRIAGELLFNPNEDQTSAIQENKGGRVTQVTLTDKRGKPRVLKGKVAEKVAEQIRLNDALGQATSEDINYAEELLRTDYATPNQRNNVRQTDSTQQTQSRRTENIPVDEPSQSNRIPKETQAAPATKPFQGQPEVGKRVGVTLGGNQYSTQVTRLFPDGSVEVVHPTREGKKLRVDREFLEEPSKNTIKEGAKRIAEKLGKKRDPQLRQKLLERFKELKKLAGTVTPNLDIKFYNTPVEFVKAGFSALEAATYDPETQTVHVNMAFVRDNSLEHEVTHPILTALFDTHPELTDKFYYDLKNLAKDNPLYIQYLEYGRRYEDKAQSQEEAIVEFIADVLAGKVELPESKRQKVVDEIIKLIEGLINKIKGFENLKLTDLFNSETSLIQFAETLRQLQYRAIGIDYNLKQPNSGVRRQLADADQVVELIAAQIGGELGRGIPPSDLVDGYLRELDAYYGTSLGIDREQVISKIVSNLSASIASSNSQVARRRLLEILETVPTGDRMVTVLKTLDNKMSEYGKQDVLTDETRNQLAEDFIQETLQSISNNTNRTRWDIRGQYKAIARAVINTLNSPDAQAQRLSGWQSTALGILIDNAKRQARTQTGQSRFFEEVVMELVAMDSAVAAQEGRNLRARGLRGRDGVAGSIGSKIRGLIKGQLKTVLGDVEAGNYILDTKAVRESVMERVAQSGREMFESLEKELGGSDMDKAVDKIIKEVKKGTYKAQRRFALTGKEIADFLVTGKVPKGTNLTLQEREAYKALRRVFNRMDSTGATSKTLEEKLRKKLEDGALTYSHIVGARAEYEAARRLSGANPSTLSSDLAFFDSAVEQLTANAVPKKTIVDALADIIGTPNMSDKEVKEAVKAKLVEALKDPIVYADLRGELELHLKTELSLSDDTMNFLNEVIRKKLEKVVYPITRGFIREELKDKVRESVFDAQQKIKNLEAEKPTATPSRLKQINQEIEILSKAITKKTEFANNLTQKKFSFNFLPTLMKNGVLGDVAFQKQVSEYLGLDALTPQDLFEIQDRLTRIENTSSEFDKNQQITDLAKFLVRLENRKLNLTNVVQVSAITMEMIYVGLLGNYKTAIAAGVMSGISTARNLAVATPINLARKGGVQRTARVYISALNSLQAAIRTIPDVIKFASIEDPASDIKGSQVAALRGKILEDRLATFVNDSDRAAIKRLPAGLLYALVWGAPKALKITSMLVDSFNKGYLTQTFLEDLPSYTPAGSFDTTPLAQLSEIEARVQQRIDDLNAERKDRGIKPLPKKEENKLRKRLKRDATAAEIYDSGQYDSALKEAEYRSSQDSAMGPVSGYPGAITNWMSEKRATLTERGDVTGSLGALGMAVAMPFASVAGAFANLTMSFVPLNTTIKTAYDTHLHYKNTGKFTITNTRRIRKGFGKSSIVDQVNKTPSALLIDFLSELTGTVALGAILSSLFDEDEEGNMVISEDSPIRITGRFIPYSERSTKKVGESVYLPTTLYWNGEPVLNYNGTPMDGMLSMIGGIHDDLAYTVTPKNAKGMSRAQAATLAAQSLTASIGSGGWSSGMQTTLNFLEEVGAIFTDKKDSARSQDQLRASYNKFNQTINSLTNMALPLSGQDKFAFDMYQLFKQGAISEAPEQGQNDALFRARRKRLSNFLFKNEAEQNAAEDIGELSGQFTQDIDLLGNPLNYDDTGRFSFFLGDQGSFEKRYGGEVPKNVEAVTRFEKAANGIKFYYPPMVLSSKGNVLISGEDSGLTAIYQRKTAENFGELVDKVADKILNLPESGEEVATQYLEDAQRTARDHTRVEMYLDILDQAGVKYPKSKFYTKKEDRWLDLDRRGSLSTSKLTEWMIENEVRLEMEDGEVKLMSFDKPTF